MDTAMDTAVPEIRLDEWDDNSESPSCQGDG